MIRGRIQFERKTENGEIFPIYRTCFLLCLYFPNKGNTDKVLVEINRFRLAQTKHSSIM